MAIVKWVFWITFWVLVAAFFHYTLPQKDIVRVTDTYEKRIDFGGAVFGDGQEFAERVDVAVFVPGFAQAV